MLIIGFTLRGIGALEKREKCVCMSVGIFQAWGGGRTDRKQYIDSKGKRAGTIQNNARCDNEEIV